jgi:hypothetical protein
MSAKGRAINKGLSAKDLRAKVLSGSANRIERERDQALKSVGDSVPADLNELWEYANEQLKHLDPKQTLDGVLFGEHDPKIQELFEARRGIYLGQLELFKLWDQPVKVDTTIKEIQSQLVDNYLKINSSRNTNT